MPSDRSNPLPSDRPKNRLLRALPEAEFERLRPDLITIPTPTRHVFHTEGTAITDVFFPNGGVASVTSALSDGTTVETATIGAEGMLGIDLLLAKTAIAAGNVMMQVGNSNAEQLGASAFRRELDRQGVFADVIGRYAQVVLAQMMQSAVCNARHHVHERCCRWLLMTHDRVGSDRFHLSHEFLGVMLGVRRQSVSVVAGTLQTAGLIVYKYGHVTVLDRKGLEAGSCECYGVVRRRFDALFP